MRLVLKWPWPWEKRVRCRDCRFNGRNYLTAIQGQIFRFGTCERLPHDCRLVDPDVERECGYFEVKGEDDSAVAI